MRIADLQIVQNLLEALNLVRDDEPDDGTALVIASAMACGPHSERLAEFTQLPVQFVDAIRRRMIDAHLWTETNVNCDHWFDEAKNAEPYALWFDVLVGEGFFTRVWDRTMRDYVYCGPDGSRVDPWSDSEPRSRSSCQVP